MNREPDFIGIGGGRSGTRWINVCLYEHPQVHMPVGEPHFFSRQKNWSKGYQWYDLFFKDCPSAAKTGEMSNSYLADVETPEKIYKQYPDVKLIVSFRNPAERAFSCYLNDIKAGVIKPTVSFNEALKERYDYYIGEGRHATNIKRYLKLFPRERILMLIHGDINIKDIYEFIGVDVSFEASFLNKRVNIGRVPRFVWLDRLFVNVSAFLRKKGFYSIWWFVKKRGLAEKILKLNTKSQPQLQPVDRAVLYRIFKGEIEELEEILGYKLPSWHV